MELKQEIKDYIENYTLDCRINGYELNIKKLCDKLGIELFSGSFENDSTSGIICATGEESSPYQILVNEKHPITRRRFTACHEIGHYISYKCNSYSLKGFQENHGYKDTAIYYRKDAMTSKAETEANEIAENLLMPTNLVNHFIKNNKHWTLEGISEAFFVSSAAMAIKLEKLNLEA